MPVRGRTGGSWGTSGKPYAKHAGTWKLARYVWAKVGGVWRRAFGDLTGATIHLYNDPAGTPYNGYCYSASLPEKPYYTQCSASQKVYAQPVEGVGPFTYTWTVVSNPSSAAITYPGDMIQIGGFGRGGWSKTVQVKCRVTDTATGQYADTATLSVQVYGIPEDF